MDLENPQFENGNEVEDGRCPSFSGVNPGQERPGPRFDLKHDGECPSFSGVNVQLPSLFVHAIIPELHSKACDYLY